MNFEQARFNMIEQQIRPWDVLNTDILDLMASLPREQFVPEGYRELAYADISVPLNDKHAMMPPRVEARILQALKIRADDKILEVGTGSGFLTALLAKSGQHVYSVDISPELSAQAQANLDKQNIKNVTLEVGDASKGWSKYAPYDVIVITGAMAEFPTAFLDSLQRAGRVFTIVGTAPVMEAKLFTRIGESELREEALFETDVPLLENAEPAPQFLF